MECKNDQMHYSDDYRDYSDYCDCTKCEEYNKMKKKVKKYEKVVNLLLDDSIITKKIKEKNISIPATSNSELYQSVYIKKNKDGENEKYRKSNLGQDFYVVEESNLQKADDLSKSMRECYNEQNYSHKYKKTQDYINKGGKVWKVVGTALYVGKWFIGFI